MIKNGKNKTKLMIASISIIAILIGASFSSVVAAPASMVSSGAISGSASEGCSECGESSEVAESLPASGCLECGESSAPAASEGCSECGESSEVAESLPASDCKECGLESSQSTESVQTSDCPLCGLLGTEPSDDDPFTVCDKLVSAVKTGIEILASGIIISTIKGLIKLGDALKYITENKLWDDIFTSLYSGVKNVIIGALEAAKIVLTSSVLTMVAGLAMMIVSTIIGDVVGIVMGFVAAGLTAMAAFVKTPGAKLFMLGCVEMLFTICEWLDRCDGDPKNLFSGEVSSSTYSTSASVGTSSTSIIPGSYSL